MDAFAERRSLLTLRRDRGGGRNPIGRVGASKLPDVPPFDLSPTGFLNKAESDQVVEALRKRGVEVQYMVKDNEGHGFRNEENQFDFYAAMENFFAQHLHP